MGEVAWVNLVRVRARARVGVRVRVRVSPVKVRVRVSGVRVRVRAGLLDARLNSERPPAASAYRVRIRGQR